jgi:GntR family transcriptional repressor for pyruvate dehydrogenase complex
MVLTSMTPGTSLPSEADLAARFEVSRLTVREAIKMLSGRGLLDVGRGRRAIVRQPDRVALSDFLSGHIQSDPKGLFDLMELRLATEVLAASLAARRLNRAGLAALEATINGMRESIVAHGAGSEPDAAELRFHDHDLEFHGAIALASGNRLISNLFEAMAVPLRRGFYLSRRGHFQRGGTVEETMRMHEQIFEAIREGNAKSAEVAMRAHLEETERDIRAALDEAWSPPAASAPAPPA